jgi:hypothetical protein
MGDMSSWAELTEPIYTEDQSVLTAWRCMDDAEVSFYELSDDHLSNIRAMLLRKGRWDDPRLIVLRYEYTRRNAATAT